MSVSLELVFLGEFDENNEDDIKEHGLLWKNGTLGACKLSKKCVSDLNTLKHVNKANVKDWAKKGVTPNTSKDVKVQPLMKFSLNGVGGLVEMIDTFDREGTADANSTYARAGTYATGGTNKPGERIPKAGVYAEAGVGEASAKWRIFEAVAKGPNASASARANVLGVNATATAGLGTATANAGPLGVKVGLQLDTGVAVGAGGFMFKFLGFGFEVGPKTSISILGNEVSINFA